MPIPKSRALGVKEDRDRDLEELMKYRESAIYFIMAAWGMVPQPVRREYIEEVEMMVGSGELGFRVEMFEDFRKGEHISWQQWQLLLGEVVEWEKQPGSFSLLRGRRWFWQPETKKLFLK